MKITIKATRLDLTPSIKTYIQTKIGSLDKFLKSLEMRGDVEVWLEIGRTTAHHHKGNVFRAEADVRLPGRILRADYEDKNIRTAIDKIRNTLHSEIEKYKTTRSEREGRRRSK